MRIDISFPGGVQVDASTRGLTMSSDQPEKAGGAGAFPSPYVIFLSSLGQCAGYFVLKFCQSRDIDPSTVTLTQHVKSDRTTHLASEVRFEIAVTPDFPAKYHKALTRVVEQCTVKRSLAAPPSFETEVVVRDPASAEDSSAA